MIALLLTFSLQANAHLCDVSYKPPADFEKVKKQIDLKMMSFANKKVIAEKADGTLSKMIAAKSPFVAGWMKKHTNPDATEEEIVRIWRAYYAKNFVLTLYPGQDKAVDTEIENFVDSVTAEFATKAFQERMEKYFGTAKLAAIETIKSFALDDKSKAAILARVQSIKLYWPLKFKTARNNKVPLDIIDWGIAYDPQFNEINMGVNAMAYPDENTYIAVFAHETGHSFDSCRWGAYFPNKSAWPFQKVGECLRSEKGVGAKKRDDNLLDKMVSEKKVDSEFVKSMKENPTCNKLAYPPIGIQADQLPESFADWFSAEVMAHLNLASVASLRSDLCEKHELVPGSSYPTNEARLSRIYFANPLLKAKLQSTAGKDPMMANSFYCSLK